MCSGDGAHESSVKELNIYFVVRSTNSAPEPVSGV